MAVTWTSKIADVANNQIPFAIAETLNMLAKGAVEDARAAAGIDLNVKSKTLIKNFIFAPSRLKATKNRFTARVLVGSPTSSKPDRGNILTQQEDAGTKSPTGGRSVALPSRDIRKPGAKRAVLQGYELSKLGPFAARSNLKTRDVSMGSKPGLFFITMRKGTSAGKRMLLQRYGRGKKSVRGLWLFVPSTRLTPKLRFNATVKRHVQLNLTKAFKASFSKALASARPLKSTIQSSRI